MVSFGPAYAAQANEETKKLDDPRIDQLIQKANRRVAQGESPDVIERWLSSAVEQLGIEKSPQAWDVYGRHRWTAEKNSPAPPK